MKRNQEKRTFLDIIANSIPIENGLASPWPFYENKHSNLLNPWCCV